MSGNLKFSFAAVALVAAALTGAVYYCWQIRENPQTRVEARKAALRELRAQRGDDVAAFLNRLADERHLRTWFDNQLPYLHVAWDTKVPADFIAQLAEDAFLKFAGNGETQSEDVPHLKQIMAFAERFLPNCTTESAANALRDRLLDGHFLIGDFEGAIAMLEKGMPGHDPAWCKATVAKLRAHRAEETARTAKDPAAVTRAKREAIDNYVAFGEYMLTEAMKKFEDCDPTTGVIYSCEWVAAKNFMRSAKFAEEIGEAAQARALKARAVKYYTPALEKAKEDQKSLDALKAEMKSYGL